MRAPRGPSPPGIKETKAKGKMKDAKWRSTRNGPTRLVPFAFCLLPSLAGVVLVLVMGARAGPGVTPDSVTYLSTAESLRADGSFRRYDGAPYVEFPPLYPLVLAA